jgi:hypothetical protein
MTRYTPDWLQQGTYSAAMDRRVLQALWPGAASSGCAVTAGSGMTVNVAAGQMAVPTANATGTLVCTSDAVEPVALAAAPGTNSRIDLVVCQARGNDLDGGANNDFIFAAVTGTVAASPVAPAVPANAVALAQIAVGTGVAAIVAGNITDTRLGGMTVPGHSVARAFRTAALSPASGDSQINLDTATFDPLGLLTPGQGGQFVVTQAGYYQVNGAAQISAAAAGDRMMASLYQNNTLTAYGTNVHAQGAFSIGSAASDVLRCAAGDRIGLGIWVSVSRALVVAAPASPRNFLSITLASLT